MADTPSRAAWQFCCPTTTTYRGHIGVWRGHLHQVDVVGGILPGGVVVIDVQEGDVHLQGHEGQRGRSLAEQCGGGGTTREHTLGPMGHLSQNSMGSTHFGGLGAGPGLSSSREPVPSRRRQFSRGMNAMTPEVLPVTGDISQPIQAWQKVTDRVGDLAGSLEIPSVSAKSQAISLLTCHPGKLFIGLRILLAAVSQDEMGFWGFFCQVPGQPTPTPTPLAKQGWGTAAVGRVRARQRGQGGLLRESQRSQVGSKRGGG